MIRKIENISKQIEDQIQIKELEVSNIIRDVPPIILILERGFVVYIFRARYNCFFKFFKRIYIFF